MTDDIFTLPPEAMLDHCPKCGAPLTDTGVRITTPSGQVRRVMVCGELKWYCDGTLGYPEYEASLPL